VVEESNADDNAFDYLTATTTKYLWVEEKCFVPAPDRGKHIDRGTISLWFSLHVRGGGLGRVINNVLDSP
jgi:hypothetical protein